MTDKRYDQAFKDHAVHLALTSGKTRQEIADELMILVGTLNDWVRKAKRKAKHADANDPRQSEELLRLRRQNAALRKTLMTFLDS